MYISLCENLTNPKIIGNDTIDHVIEKIKTGYTKDQVLKARLYGKGTEQYNWIKAQIPTYTPNASFYYKRALRCLERPSGFVYLDFDDFDEGQLLEQFHFIYSYWKSLSGKGFGALAKVNSINPQNFKNTWNFLEEYFKKYNIYLDKQTCDITRQNVLSYDPDLYVNDKCIPLDANLLMNESSTYTYDFQDILYTDNTNTTSPEVSASPLITNSTGITLGTVSTILPSRIIYNTVLDNYYGQDFLVFENGRPSRSGFLPPKIKTGNRHKWMSGHTISMLFNNKLISLDELTKVVLSANRVHCDPPMDYTEIISIVKWYWNKHSGGTLNYNAHLKKIWIDPNAGISRDLKRKIIGSQTGILRRKKTLNTLQSSYSRLKETEMKVTQKLLASKTGISLRTVKSYWEAIVK